MRLTDAEREALRGLGQGQVVPAVERILAARRAEWEDRVRELADEWQQPVKHGALISRWSAANRLRALLDDESGQEGGW